MRPHSSSLTWLPSTSAPSRPSQCLAALHKHLRPSAPHKAWLWRLQVVGVMPMDVVANGARVLFRALLVQLKAEAGSDPTGHADAGQVLAESAAAAEEQPWYGCWLPQVRGRMCYCQHTVLHVLRMLSWCQGDLCSQNFRLRRRCQLCQNVRMPRGTHHSDTPLPALCWRPAGAGRPVGG